MFDGKAPHRRGHDQRLTTTTTPPSVRTSRPRPHLPGPSPATSTHPQARAPTDLCGGTPSGRRASRGQPPGRPPRCAAWPAGRCSQVGSDAYVCGGLVWRWGGRAQMQVPRRGQGWWVGDGERGVCCRAGCGAAPPTQEGGGLGRGRQGVSAPCPAAQPVLPHQAEALLQCKVVHPTPFLDDDARLCAVHQHLLVRVARIGRALRLAAQAQTRPLLVTAPNPAAPPPHLRVTHILELRGREGVVEGPGAPAAGLRQKPNATPRGQ